jgi:hypothetical protein
MATAHFSPGFEGASANCLISASSSD